MVLEARVCGECDGTGRNGTLGGYRLLCCSCRGQGFTVRDVAGYPVVPVIPPDGEDDPSEDDGG